MGETIDVLGQENVGAVESQKPLKTLREVEPTSFSRSTPILNPEHVAEIVEEPLVPACEILYQKNIQTEDSTANKKTLEAGAGAGISINWDSLSEENKKIAQSLGLKPVPFDDFQIVEIAEPVDESTTVPDLAEKFVVKANQFLLQEPKWIPSYTINELKKSYGIGENEECVPEDFDQYFYDIDSKKFYLSEDHSRKVKEWEREHQNK